MSMGGRVIPIRSMYGISTYIYHKFMINVGKYTSPMDPMGSNNRFLPCFRYIAMFFEDSQRQSFGTSRGWWSSKFYPPTPYGEWHENTTQIRWVYTYTVKPILLMVQESPFPTTWDGVETLQFMVDKLPFPQLVSLPDFWTINSMDHTLAPCGVSPW